MPLFDRVECRNKAWAASSPEYHALGSDDRIVDLVRALLGDDVVLWGASLVVREPGRVHAWHTDIESAATDAETASVWIGLEHTDRRTASASRSRR